MRLAPRVVLCCAPLALLLFGGCDRSSTPEPDAPTEPQAQPEEEYVPPPNSDWGDGMVTGIVKLKWGKPVPEGSNMRVTLWHNSDNTRAELIPVSGAGPWAFEFKIDDPSSFKPEDIFGVGVMIEVPPEGEAMYLTKPPTTQIWQYEAASKTVELDVVAIDPRYAGEGEMPE